MLAAYNGDNSKLVSWCFQPSQPNGDNDDGGDVGDDDDDDGQILERAKHAWESHARGEYWGSLIGRY